MKADIHPTYHPKATFTCACGAVFTMGSIKEKVSIEICSNCHPFYTGNEKVLDTAGRLDKFNARRSKATAAPKKAPKK